MFKKCAFHGLWLGILVVAWTFVMGFTGWYKDPAKLFLFFLVIPLEVVAVCVCLAGTARMGAGYGRQILNGLLLSLVAGALIMPGSIAFTTKAFPTYFEDLRHAHGEVLRKQGKTEDEVQRLVDAGAAGQGPVANAVQGFIGTVATGLVVSLIAAIWLRKKGA